MKQLALFLTVVLLAFVPARGDDPPKEEKKELTPKEQYQALVKEYAKQQTDTLSELRKTKDEDENKKLAKKYSGLGKEYAGRFYEFAEEHAKEPVAVDALFWIVQNGSGSEVFKDASAKVVDLVGEMPMNDLTKRVRATRFLIPEIVTAIVERAKRDESDAQAPDLLGWVAVNSGMSSAGKEATGILLEKHIDHKAVEQLCSAYSRGYRKDRLAALKSILEKTSNESTKASATLAIGKSLYARTDELGDDLSECDKVAAESESYFQRVIDKFGEKFGAKKKEAELDLKMLNTLRVGKPAPEIEAEDLEGTEFKLTEYRGKVVLLDFWGHW